MAYLSDGFLPVSDVTIECDPSGVQIVINGTALEEAIPNLDPSTLRVGQGPWLSQCIPDETEPTSGKDLMTFKFSYGDCHPTIADVSKVFCSLSGLAIIIFVQFFCQESEWLVGFYILCAGSHKSISHNSDFVFYLYTKEIYLVYQHHLSHI